MRRRRMRWGGRGRGEMINEVEERKVKEGGERYDEEEKEHPPWKECSLH